MHASETSRARLQQLGKHGRQQPQPGRVDPALVQVWSRLIAPIVRLAFRPAIENEGNLPPRGAYLLVANHSGLGNADILCLIETLRSQAPGRLPAAMVHPVSFNSWPAGGWMARLGAIPSTYDAAIGALSRGVPVLVFPGGDIDATRPVWRAGRVDFGGRKGFLKIAREAGVPVVPVGIRGSDFTAPILFRSSTLAKLLVFPRMMGVHLFPVTLLGTAGAAALIAARPIIGWSAALGMAVLWVATPLSQAPWIPWKVRIRVGKALTCEDLFPNSTDEALGRAYDRVRSAVEDLAKRRSRAAERA